MREASIVSELRAALRRQGVWGVRAERLMQEWTDHVRDDAAGRVEQGAEPDAARDAAWGALGEPEVLARSAASELAKASWSGRHPWQAGLLLPVLAWLALLVAIVFVPGLLAFQLWNTETLENAHSPGLIAVEKCWEFVFNWLPWLLSVAWLRWLAVHMHGGWKLFRISAVVLTLCSTSVWMTIQPALHGPNSGSLMISAVGVLEVIARLLGKLIGHGAWLGPSPSWAALATPSQVQAALMILGILVFHFKATARPDASGTVRLN